MKPRNRLFLFGILACLTCLCIAVFGGCQALQSDLQSVGTTISPSAQPAIPLSQQEQTAQTIAGLRQDVGDAYAASFLVDLALTPAEAQQVQDAIDAANGALDQATEENNAGQPISAVKVLIAAAQSYMGDIGKVRSTATTRKKHKATIAPAASFNWPRDWEELPRV